MYISVYMYISGNCTIKVRTTEHISAKTSQFLSCISCFNFHLPIQVLIFHRFWIGNHYHIQQAKHNSAGHKSQHQKQESREAKLDTPTAIPRAAFQGQLLGVPGVMARIPVSQETPSQIVVSLLCHAALEGQEWWHFVLNFNQPKKRHNQPLFGGHYGMLTIKLDVCIYIYINIIYLYIQCRVPNDDFHFRSGNMWSIC